MKKPNPITDFMAEIEAECARANMAFDLRAILFCIRDIPYGRPASPRDPVSVLTDWKGTCSGKHLLVHTILDALGLRSKLFCLPYLLDNALNTLPREVVQVYMGQGVWDVHNYLEIDTPTGPVNVDVTWARELAEFGFPATLHWDGKHDFRSAAPVGEPVLVSSDVDLTSTKEQLLQRLNPGAARVLRERYIEDLSVFASKHSTQGARGNGIVATLGDIRWRYAYSGV
jgi:hypothetical protein